MRNPFGWDLPAGVTNKMIDEAYGGEDHLKGCPKSEDAPETCVCGHLKDPHGKEPGHRLGVCQGKAPSGHMPCGCDGYEQDQHCKCMEISENIEADRADAAEARAEERRCSESPSPAEAWADEMETNGQ